MTCRNNGVYKGGLQQKMSMTRVRYQLHSLKDHATTVAGRVIKTTIAPQERPTAFVETVVVEKAVAGMEVEELTVAVVEDVVRPLQDLTALVINVARSDTASKITLNSKLTLPNVQHIENRARVKQKHKDKAVSTTPVASR